MTMPVKAMTLVVVVVFGLLLSCHHYSNGQEQRQCEKEFGPIPDLQKKLYDFVIAYNISSTKNVYSCVDFLEEYHGLDTTENFTITYVEGGVKYNRCGTLKLANNKGTYFYLDNPDEVHSIYGEQKPNGVYVNYICNRRGDEFIWIAYNRDQDLAKEAEELAKEFTDNPADYKINRDGC